MKVNHLIVDIETTGLSTLWDEPIQIAVGKGASDGSITTEVFWINTERKIHPKAQAVHGITSDFLRIHGMTPELGAKRYNDILWENNPCVVIGYNLINFDQPMLQSWLARKIKGNFKFSPCVATQDVMFMCCVHFKQKKWPRLLESAAHLNIEIDKSSLHDAKYDVELTWEIYKRLEGISG